MENENNEQLISFQCEFENFINDFHDEMVIEKCNSTEEYENTELLPQLEQKQLAIDEIVQKFNSIQTVLSDSEKNIIDSCDDKMLKELLVLNRAKHMKLLNIFKQTKDIMVETQKEINGLNSRIQAEKDKVTANPVNMAYYKLAAPYFKDQQFYSCPTNDDCLRKKRDGELSIYNYNKPCRWTFADSNHLINGISFSYKMKQQNDIKKKIETIESKEDISFEDTIEIEKLKEKLSKLEVSNEKEVPLLNDKDSVNWYKVSEIFMKEKFSEHGCKNFWSICLHPDINKNEWTLDENNKLLKLAEKYNYQNWDVIAKELKTNRTPFIVCVHFWSKIYDRYKKTKFTQEEDDLLMKCVGAFQSKKYIEWRKIAEKHFKDRSFYQLRHRYRYYLSPQQRDIRIGKFSDAEDILLMILIDNFGKDFVKCAMYIPRTSMQLKNRFNCYFKNNLISTEFTPEEDKMIYNYVKEHGTRKWNKLGTILQRNRTLVRQRYITIKKFINTDPDFDFLRVPRRKTMKRQVASKRIKFLREIADEFCSKGPIPTLEDVEKFLEVKPESKIKPKAEKKKPNPHWKKVEMETIDDLLINYFKNTVKIKQPKAIASSSINEAVANTIKILETMQIKLDIPEDLESISNLDVVDRAILKKLSDHPLNLYKKTTKKELIPPSLYTAIALRGFLLAIQEDKNSKRNDNIYKLTDLPTKTQISDNEILWSMEQSLTQLDDDTFLKVECQRHLFRERLKQLLLWTTVLSEEGPNLTCVENLHLEKRAGSPILQNISKKQKTHQHIEKELEKISQSNNFQISSNKKDIKNSHILNSDDNNEENDNDDESIMGDIKILDTIINQNMPSCSTDPY